MLTARLGGGEHIHQHDPKAESASLVFELAAVTRPAEPRPDAAAINPHTEKKKKKEAERFCKRQSREIMMSSWRRQPGMIHGFSEKRELLIS